MKLSIQINEAFRNLLSLKLRSLLAIIGILVGTASVVAMVSGGELATRQALQQFKVLGINLLAVSVNDSQTATLDNSGEQNKLSLQIANGSVHASNDILQVAPYTNLYNPLNFQHLNLHASTIGVTDDFMNITKLQLQKGRFISDLDRYSYFCVIGNNVYQQIKNVSPDPIGTQIKLGKNYFTIVGILKNWDSNSFIYANLNDSIFIPIQTSLILNQYTQIYNIIMKLTENADINLVEKNLTQYFKTNAPTKELYIRSAKQFIRSMEKQKQILTLFLGLVGSIALIVGGIGVMNIMLVSVSERKKEIGIRIALGAKRKDIQRLFLVEAVMLSLSGGILGVIIGVIISFIIAAIKSWDFILFFSPPIVGFTVSVIIGIFFGFYPAHKASKLNPIDTLRSE